MSDVVNALRSMLDAGDFAGLAFVVLLGSVLAVWFSLIWLRVFRWVFSLFGLRV